MPTTTARLVAETSPSATRFWPEGWWRIMERRIGIIPIPVFLLLAALITGFVVSGSLPNEINVWIGVLALFGFFCAEIGKRIRILRNIGGAAILVGTLLGLGAFHTFYYVVIPIMAGGVGEGAIPLSLGYASILDQPQGDLFAQVLPPVMLGSLTAILLAGTLNYFGKKYPKLTGEGRLQPGEHDEMDPVQEEITGHINVSHIAAAGITAMALYLVGMLGFRLFGFPAPVSMLFLAVLLKLTQALPPKLQEGSFVVYKFFSSAVTYPLLFAIGVALTPWDKLVSAFTLPNLITIVATVGTIMATGFFVGRWINMYPIDVAIVNACHSGQGGTGDVAILTAANRMVLMPFAQIATRIGGAITVTLALVAMARFG